MKCADCVHYDVCEYACNDDEIKCRYYELPRPHGRWKKVGKNSAAYSCSICFWLKNYTPCFCENCGARMKAGD